MPASLPAQVDPLVRRPRLLIATLTIVALLLAGCTGAVDDYKDATQNMRDTEVTSDTKNGCDVGSMRSGETRMSSMVCDDPAAAGKTHKLELNGCVTSDAAEATFIATGDLESGSVEIVVTSGSEPLYSTTITSADGSTYIGEELAIHGAYRMEAKMSSDYSGEFTAFISCSVS